MLLTGVFLMWSLLFRNSNFKSPIECDENWKLAAELQRKLNETTIDIFYLTRQDSHFLFDKDLYLKAATKNLWTIFNNIGNNHNLLLLSFYS